MEKKTRGVSTSKRFFILENINNFFLKIKVIFVKIKANKFVTFFLSLLLKLEKSP